MSKEQNITTEEGRDSGGVGGVGGTEGGDIGEASSGTTDDEGGATTAAEFLQPTAPITTRRSVLCVSSANHDAGSHRACYDCLAQHRDLREPCGGVACPLCPEALAPPDVRAILDDSALLEILEEHQLRRFLPADPDTRWCPAPDCRSSH
ncbi:unnamed protein product [Coregonus sp. 'balchen']|nr:unnamed protein product [Coregonus sp. 'balchen']